MSERYNTTPSEGHASAREILRRVEPTRLLFDPSRARLKYTPSQNTNVARTFRKARLLARIQAAQA